MSGVLVLDDDKAVMDYTALALQTGDFEAVTFSHPHDALNAIQSEAFDLAILDINMPEMNGLQVLARIRAIQPNLPVIMITGRHDAATAVQSFRLGAVDYLEKPASVLQIREAAQKAFSNS
jgi:DNA-binding NtrC family response regulator